MRDILLQSIIEAFPDHTIVTDREHCIVAANGALKGLIGRYLHNFDTPFSGCPLDEMMAAGRPVEKDCRVPGDDRWIHAAVYPLGYKSPEGKDLYLHLCSDITEEMRMREKYRYGTIVQNALNEILRISLMPEGLTEIMGRILKCIISIPGFDFEAKGAIFIKESDNGGLVMVASEGLSAALRSTCERLTEGKCICGLVAAERRMIFTGSVDSRHGVTLPDMTDHGHYCTPVLLGDDLVGVINLYVRAGYEPREQDTALLTAIADVVAGIIRKKQADTELLHAQKMNMVGIMASGVAHDFNNLLTVIEGYSSIALDNLDEGDPFYDAFSQISGAVSRASLLSKQLLEFARKRKGCMRVRAVNLNETVANAVRMLKCVIPDAITVTTYTEESLWPVSADPEALEQVVTNLIINARDAIRASGRITVRTENILHAATDDDYAEADRNGKFVRCTVSDTGDGMEASVVSSIFRPFFTTKEAGKGTGLGLAVVRKIVSDSHGRVDVESEPGKGSSFIIELPAAG